MTTALPTPATVARTVRARPHRAIAAAPRGTRRPQAPAPEVRLVVRPASLVHWQAWIARVDARDVTLTGTIAVARGQLDGVAVRLVGQGVPALTAGGA